MQYISSKELDELLNHFNDLHILVVGDFFLDKYLIIDRSLSEWSLETGLEAHQVVQIRNSPGAAGSVTSNLRAMDIHVSALGVIGDDGNGYEDLNQLSNIWLIIDEVEIWAQKNKFNIIEKELI